MDIIPGLHIMSTYKGSLNNSIECTLGDNINQNTETDQAQWVQQVGFASLPGVAVPGQPAPEAVVLKDSGNRGLVIGTRDPTSQQIYGNLQPGEFCAYAGGSNGAAQGRVMGKQDGSVYLYTTDTNDPTGNGVYLKVGPTGLSFMAPFGKMVFDASGFHITTAAGSSFHLGGLNFPIPGVPSSAFSSFAQISASSITVDGSAVMLGPAATGVYMSAVYSDIPPPGPGVPILGVGTGSVVVAAAGSSGVFITV